MGGAGVRSPTGIRFQIPSDPDWIDFTVQILVQHAERTNACDLLHLGHLRVSLFEALTNSVIHGNAQRQLRGILQRDHDARGG